MKVKNKGKVHPTPLPTCSAGDSFSVLKLLPATILALISVLSLQDRDVLAYMLTRSLHLSNPSFEKQGKTKRSISSDHRNHNHNHKPPLFDCDCFDCYTWYWFKWDSSPNRELIHLAIEAFEEQALAGELSRKKSKKRVKMGGRCSSGKCDECSSENGISSPAFVHGPLVYNVSTVPVMAEECKMVETQKGSAVEVKLVPEDLFEEVAPPASAANVVAAVADIHHRGLARKVLPDVLGLLNSRLWSLWSPNV